MRCLRSENAVFPIGVFSPFCLRKCSHCCKVWENTAVSRWEGVCLTMSFC